MSDRRPPGELDYATVPSPLGDLLLAATPRGIVRLAYLRERAPDEVLDDLAARMASSRPRESPNRLDRARRQLDAYFEGRSSCFDLALDRSLVGPFAERVLAWTAAIPYGQVATYGEVALGIGHARAARAVGNALGSNPVPIVLPCHRVVRAGGGFGGYTGGCDIKARLLELERAEALA